MALLAKPCVYFQSNSCPLSSAECDYAHILVPQDPLNPLKAPQSTLRTKPCKFYASGTCKQGVWCRFKHPAILSGRSGFDIGAERQEIKWADEDPTDKENFDLDALGDSDDIRDIDPQWRASHDQHPKYRSKCFETFFWSY